MDSNPSFQDDIPLRDHPGMPAKDNNSTDHVYDAPAPALMEEGRRRPNRLSGLGKGLLKTKKRIPWVVYTLTLIQVVVFLVEIVKNGMFYLIVEGH